MVDLSMGNIIPDAYFKIYNSYDPIFLKYAWENDNNIAQNSYSVDVSGIYYLEVSDYGNNSTGAYTIEVDKVLLPDDHSDSINKASLITLGNLYEANLEIIGDIDYFKIDLIAGQKYLFETNGLSIQNFSNLDIYYENGSGFNHSSSSSDLKTWIYYTRWATTSKIWRKYWFWWEHSD